MSYLTFTEGPGSPSGKTRTWEINAGLGTIAWYGPWRKYCFFSTAAKIFDYACLLEIADFCQAQTIRHRTGV